MGVSLICVTSCGRIALWSDENIHEICRHLAATLAPITGTLISSSSKVRVIGALLQWLSPQGMLPPTVCAYEGVTAAFCAVYTKEKQLAALLLPSNGRPAVVSNELVP